MAPGSTAAAAAPPPLLLLLVTLAALAGPCAAAAGSVGGGPLRRLTQLSCSAWMVPNSLGTRCYPCTDRNAVGGGPGRIKYPLTASGTCILANDTVNGCTGDRVAVGESNPCKSCQAITPGTVPNSARSACYYCTDVNAIGGGAGKIKAPLDSTGTCTLATDPTNGCTGDAVAYPAATPCVSCATIAPGTVANSIRSACVFCTSTVAPNGGPGRIKYPALDPTGSCIAATDAVNGCKGDSIAVAAPAQCMSCESVRGGTVPNAARSACQSCLTATAVNGGLGTVKFPLSSEGVCVNATSANGCKGDEIATSNPVPCRSCALISNGTVANSLRSACVFCTSTGAPNGGPGKVKYPPLDPAGSCVAANGPNGCTGDAVAVGEPIQCKSCSLISANTVANTARSACVFCTDPTAPNGGAGKVKWPNDTTGACVSSASTCTGDSISVKGSCVSCQSLSPGTVPNANRTVCYSCLDSRAINGGPGKIKAPLTSAGVCVSATDPVLGCQGDAVAVGEPTPCKSCQVVKPGSVPNANRTACYYCTDANAIGGGAGMIKVPLTSAGVCVNATDPVLGCQGDAVAVGEPTPCKSCQVVRNGTVPNAARSICWSCTDSRAVNGGPGKTKWPLSFSGTCVPNVPVDCVGAWTFTSSCSAECGGGTRPGVFVVTQPAMVNGRPCEAANGTQNGSISCNTQPCVGPGPNPWAPDYGLAGGWTIYTSDEVAGARVINPSNADKEGAIVAARVASALGALGTPATSDSRRLVVNPTLMSSANYTERVADYIVNGLYGSLARAGADNYLLRKDTLVLTSVHRFGLYLAEALHARVLPLQVISFADSWSQVEDAARSSVILAGQDGGYDGLWLWNKVAAGEAGTAQAELPAAYKQALQEATNVVIVQPCDNWVYCNPATDPNGYECWDALNATYTGENSTVFLHTSLTRSGFGRGAALFSDAKSAGKVGKATYAQVGNLKQWEWGVPDSTVANVRDYWTNTLGRPASSLRVISDGVVEGLFTRTTDLWKAYLTTANGLAIRGYHWNSYWVAHTQLERAAATLPFVSYAYHHPGWQPVEDKARATLAADQGSAGWDAAAVAGNSRAFVNTIGSSHDITATAQTMADFGLTAANGAYFSSGVDCYDISEWDGWPGSGAKAAPAWKAAGVAVQNATLAPYSPTSFAWQPLSLSALDALGFPSTCWRGV